LPAEARPGTAVAAAGFAVAAAAMVATPLVPRGRRAGLSVAVVTGLAATTAGLAARRWGWRRTAAALGSVTAATAAVELVGSHTGVPFGRYRYTGVLRPAFRGVPAVVPLAWFAMGLPSRAAGRRAFGSTVAGGAVALTAWDLFLDPQMVAEGYWRWRRAGRYRGIPLTNYLGWVLTSAAVMALLDRALPDDPPGDGDGALAGLYGFVAVMQTLGFAAFFRDPLVALAGGVAMGVPAVLAWRRRG
jgi:putative membrane protein